MSPTLYVEVIIRNGKGNHPHYADGDYYCSICGEPYEAYGLREEDSMSKAEAAKFLNGEGCPCCQWGTKAHFLFDPAGDTASSEPASGGA